MAGKQRFVKVTVTSEGKSLASYKVLGDVTESGQRTLILERPEQATAKVKTATRKAKAAGSGSQTSFDPSQIAGVQS